MVQLQRIFLTFFLFLTACGENPQQSGGPGIMSVDIALPLKKEIVEWDEYIGRFQATESVEVRARVTGYLQEQLFEDGQYVKKGDVLFIIDQRPFKYQLQQAEARFNQAKSEYERFKSLRTPEIVSQENLDRRFQEFLVSQAQLREAKLNLEYTRVKSPIDGKVSDGFTDNGNLVEENETILTRVVSVDPMHFSFEASQGQLLKYIRLDRSGKRPGSDQTPNPVFIKLQDENKYVHVGRMDFVDNIVDEGTGTIRGRALVPNPDRIIYPGLFGRARVMGSGRYEAILLPENTIQADQDRKFVYIIGEENKVQRRYVTPGPLLDNGFVPIKLGLIGDEKIVVNGLQRIRFPNQQVQPNEIELKWVNIETMPNMDSVPSLEQIKKGGFQQNRKKENKGS